MNEYQRRNNLLTPWSKFEFPNDFARLPVQSYVEGQENATMLFITYTYRQAHLLDSYELTSFYKMWDNIKYEKRLLKKGYIVTRRE